MAEVEAVTAARADLRDLPDWPRLMSREQAAAYLGVSVNTLESRIGKPFPAPIRIGRRALYDKDALDRAVDALSPSRPESPTEKIRQGAQHGSRQVEAR